MGEFCKASADRVFCVLWVFRGLPSAYSAYSAVWHGPRILRFGRRGWLLESELPQLQLGVGVVIVHSAVGFCVFRAFSGLDVRMPAGESELPQFLIGVDPHSVRFCVFRVFCGLEVGSACSPV